MSKKRSITRNARRIKNMKVKINKTLSALDGSPAILKNEDGKETVLTLKTICVNALQFQEKDVSGSEKMKRYRLATKIYGTKDSEDIEMDLSAEDITMLKDLINKSYPSPIVVGQAWDILEQADEPPKKKEKK